MTPEMTIFLKADPHPAADIQYAAAPVAGGNVGVYWIIRCSPVIGLAEGETRWRMMT